MLDKLATDRPWLRVIHHETNGGYGKALLSGFAAAQHEWIFYTDGDAQYDASEAALLVPLATDDIDVVQGYKIGRGDSWYRKVIGRLLPPRRQAALQPEGARHRLRLPHVPPPAAHRSSADVDDRRDLRRDDALVRPRRRAVRRDPGAPLLPPVRQVAVLPAAGDRPQRPQLLALWWHMVIRGR